MTVLRSVPKLFSGSARRARAARTVLVYVVPLAALFAVSSQTTGWARRALFAVTMAIAFNFGSQLRTVLRPPSTPS